MSAMTVKELKELLNNEEITDDMKILVKGVGVYKADIIKDNYNIDSGKAVRLILFG